MSSRNPFKKITSKYVGVSLDRSSGRWKASANGVDLGLYSSEISAARAVRLKCEKVGLSIPIKNPKPLKKPVKPSTRPLVPQSQVKYSTGCVDLFAALMRPKPAQIRTKAASPSLRVGRKYVTHIFPPDQFGEFSLNFDATPPVVRWIRGEAKKKGIKEGWSVISIDGCTRPTMELIQKLYEQGKDLKALFGSPRYPSPTHKFPDSSVPKTHRDKIPVEQASVVPPKRKQSFPEPPIKRKKPRYGRGSNFNESKGFEISKGRKKKLHQQQEENLEDLSSGDEVYYPCPRKQLKLGKRKQHKLEKNTHLALGNSADKQRIAEEFANHQRSSPPKKRMKKNLPIIYEDSIVTWIPNPSAKKPPPKPYLAKREGTDSDEETDPDMILAIKNSLKEQTIFDVLRNQTPVVNCPPKPTPIAKPKPKLNEGIPSSHNEKKPQEVSQLVQPSPPEEEEQDECAICVDSIDDDECIFVPCCKKPFCHPCLFEWMDTNSTCPCCRTDITTQDVLRHNVDKPFIVPMPCGLSELTSDQRMHESTCNNAKCRIRRSNLFKTLHKKKEAEQKSLEHAQRVRAWFHAQRVRAWISEKPKGAMAQCPFCDVSIKRVRKNLRRHVRRVHKNVNIDWNIVDGNPKKKNPVQQIPKKKQLVLQNQSRSISVAPQPMYVHPLAQGPWMARPCPRSM